MRQSNQIYWNAKSQIDELCNELKGNNDKPLRRQSLNDLLDYLIREINYDVLQDRLTEKRGEQYKTWLTNYVIKRHEK